MFIYDALAICGICVERMFLDDKLLVLQAMKLLNEPGTLTLAGAGKFMYNPGMSWEWAWKHQMASDSIRARGA